MSPPVNIAVEFLVTYSTDPVLFVQEVLGAEPDDWQILFLRALQRGERRISIRSGHGVGKSTAAAWAMIWFLLTRLPVKIVVTAPSATQLFDALFAELRVWIERLSPTLRAMLNVTNERVEHVGAPSEAFISARTSRAEKPDSLAGVHSDNVMLVGDEASGIPEAVYEAAYGSMSGHSAVTILLGNPVRASGYFWETQVRPEMKWWVYKVSCFDAPRRVTKDYINDIKTKYGEDSNVYRVRVLGEFPLADDDTVIPLELIEAAVSRDVHPSPNAPFIWGLDVARFGNDSSCLVKRQSNVISEPPRVWKNLDLMQTAGVVRAEYDVTEHSRRPVEILVDSIGLGAGVVDRLRELGMPARGINVSESPSMGGTYLNLRAELWFKAKSWLEKLDCRLPKDERLRNELATVRYGFQSGSSKMKIESKDEMKKRGLQSPDVADAFVLTFAGDAGVALYGTSYQSNWSKPIRRRLAIV